MPSLKGVRDEDLLRQLFQLVKESRAVEAEVVAHIGEVELRRLYAQAACSSMFEYCRRILYLRENEAYLRITVARAARDNPVLLEMLRDGRLHLSGIARLAPHLTPQNTQAVLKRACGMSHREIRELVCELEPRPDVATSVRKLPERPATRSGAHVPQSAHGSPLQLGAPRVAPDAVNLEADGVTVKSRLAAPAGLPVVSPALPAVVEPLAPARYQVRFTASAELREKLERLQALMRSSVPDGDLARLIDIAVTEKLQRVEAKRFGSTTAPRRDISETDTTPSSRHIPAAVRRLVHARDGGRCAYRDKYGRRCAKRHDLEFHHKHPFAHGGDHSPANLTLMCRTHNTRVAEQDYGEDVMARFRAATSRASVPVDEYGARIAVQPRWLSSG
jgi:5-methylcytosine-specific restriction endonuclease McrA